MLKNTMAGAAPRYFERIDGAINEDEFLNLENTIVHVNGNLGEDSLRLVDFKPLSGNYINYLNNVINELRETSSNTETSTGSSSHGVTAASALAALQEASGKTSRASTLTTYRAYKKVVYMVIELIRQFYELPRQFRITGNLGVQRYIEFSNMGMQPQFQGMVGDVDLGYRVPVYDIYVEPEKHNSYTRMAQNELALQLYSAGVFAPQMTDQALMLLNMMDFDGKDELMQKVASNGTMMQQLQQMQALAATLAAKYQPDMVPGILAATGQGGPQPGAAPVGEGTQQLVRPSMSARPESGQQQRHSREGAQHDTGRLHPGQLPPDRHRSRRVWTERQGYRVRRRVGIDRRACDGAGLPWHPGGDGRRGRRHGRAGQAFPGAADPVPHGIRNDHGGTGTDSHPVPGTYPHHSLLRRATWTRM